MRSLKGKVIFITGASRGIGLSIALKAAKDGAKICIAAKSTEAQEKLEGTIYSAAEAIRAAGGEALPVACDIRSEEQVKAAVDACVEAFGGIDICINNASAISLTPTLKTSMKKYDLMHEVNARGTFMVSQACLPYLLKAENPHILNMCPPIDLDLKIWATSQAYFYAKTGMSFCVLGMSKEFKEQGVAVNAMWPVGMVATAAVSHLVGKKGMLKSKKPEMIADASYIVLTKPSREFTGNFCVDIDLLKDHGITDTSAYDITEADLSESGQYLQAI